MNGTIARGLALAAALGAVAQAAAEELKIGGSGGPTASLGPVAEAFHKRNPHILPILNPSLGTRGGIRAAAEGALHVGVISRALSPAEAVGLVQVEFARTPLVFATSRDKATGISLREIVAIHRGEINAWPDGSRLRLVLRPPADSDTLVLRALSEDLRKASIEAERREGMVVAITDLENADRIEEIPGALGTTTLGLIMTQKRAFRPLALDGIEPSVENAMAGRYPLHKRFYAIVRQPPSNAAQSFIRFLQSPPAHEILRKNGHWIPQRDPKDASRATPER
jgi:phosphate transport system substrate-binding protein